MISKPITIINKLGLHARAAAKFVDLASRFESHIEVERNGRIINGKSIMGVMMLAAGKDTEIMLHIKGADEQAAFNKISELIANKFDEVE
ncbi:MAG TPA: HPr family phosphocarrier protein [Chromatiales bacterium]|nr:HPr family phosphocarrier protein [Thiotrichales bacterium]HIP69591.1 HPr family phosphocarrier protein [Chromatiales bacterium]